jgi:hypothetical protein
VTNSVPQTFGEPNKGKRKMTTETEMKNEWATYIGHSKIQKILLYLLSHLREKVEIEDGCNVTFANYLGGIELSNLNDVWCGAVNVKTIKHLLFNGHYTPSQRASFSRSIKRLEGEGLITRERGVSEDGYTTHIHLTEHGQEQAFFELDWYGDKALQELLTFYGLKYDKHSKKVN